MLPSGGIRMFLVLRVYVLYYPFGGKYYPAFKGPDRMDMGLLDYIRTANPRKVQAVEVQKGEEQVTLFDNVAPSSGEGQEKKLLKRSDFLPKRLRTDHPSLASGTGGKSLASLRQSLPEGSLILGFFSNGHPYHVTMLVLPTSGVGGSSQPETSEESTDSFYETAVLSSEDAKRWYILAGNINHRLFSR
ncbi:hypothetical protein Tco_0294107 [Tanacetum coccineum]